MGFSMFSAGHSPVAIDFGLSSVKFLQVGSGEKPSLIAAAELSVPDPVRMDTDRLFRFLNEWVPKTLTSAGFKGKRVVISIPTSQTLMQHMQLAETEGISQDDLVKAQLQTQMGVSPNSVVVRAIEVCPVNRDGQSRTEMICFAISKDAVMRYVSLMKKCKLDVVGVHTETKAMIHAFDRLHRRAADDKISTLYVDMGWSGTRVAITHGNQLVFARAIQLGGRHFDLHIAKTLGCDQAAARAHRLSMRAPEGGVLESTSSAMDNAAHAASGARQHAYAADSASVGADDSGQTGTSDRNTAVADDQRVGKVPPEFNRSVPPVPMTEGAINVDLNELLDTITDELSMCSRYHRGLFPDRPVDRVIFIGGESRQQWLCQHVVEVLQVPSQLGDPLARFDITGNTKTPGVTLTEPQPGWAVACGLCSSPTDL